MNKCRYYGYELDGKHKCLCSPETINCEVVGHESCEDINNCYYKQLQQLKAENEELEEIIKADAENFEKWKSIAKKEIENFRNNGYEYRQKLEKIKEICNEIETDKAVEYILQIIKGEQDE